MKRNWSIFIIVMTLAFTGPGIVSNANAEQNTSPAAASRSDQQILVNLEGLACPFCAYGVEKQLKRISGVKDVKVNLGEGNAVLMVEPGKKITDKEIRQAVEKAGFKASEIKNIEEPNPIGQKAEGRP